MPFKTTATGNIRKRFRLAGDVKRKYTLLRTSWRVQAKLFFEHSTLHGVRYIAEKGRPFAERLMWFICVNVSAVAAMIIIVSLWEKFQTNPTITGLDTDFHNWDVAFPAITVCQRIPASMTEIDNYLEKNKFGNAEEITEFIIKLSQFSYDNLKDYRKYATKNLGVNITKLKDFAFQFMNPCKNVFDNCVWKSEKYDCCEGFYPVFTETGFCYSFNSRHYERRTPWSNELLPAFEQKYIKETDLKWSLKFDILSNFTDDQIPIYIHNSDELPGLDTKPQHIWEFNVDRISFSVKQTYTTENARQLTIKQRHCAFENELKLSIDYKYTYTACTRQCRMDTAKRLCNCVPHFYVETGIYRHCTLQELSCISRNLKLILSVDKCACQLGCSNTVYEVEKLNDNPDSKGLEAEFVSWPMVRYKREVLFGWVDLLVSFGGIAGLFLGFSLLSGVEFIYYFTIRSCCMVNMQKNELENIQKELKKQLTAYDMSLVPTFISDKHNNNHNYSNNLQRFSNRIQPKPFLIRKEDRRPLPPFGIEYIN
ncbi:Amiloride-sensitive sodium channel [Popillia japonica]|uniref:Amiloride-sensitive sodium channel n=1 Tax=Popillia japonica TaxID=7064 RepID=A0AAW1LEI6_POPJA